MVYMYETLSMNAGDCVVCMFCLYAYVHAHVCNNTCVLVCITCMVYVYALHVCAYVLYSICICNCVTCTGTCMCVAMSNEHRQV